METRKIAGKRVRYYSSIEDLPAYRHSKFSAMCMLDSGLGSDISDIDNKISRIVAKLNTNNIIEAKTELTNMRQGIRFIVQGLSFKMLSFAVMVESINDQPQNDMSDEGLQKVVKALSNEKMSVIDSILAKVKKKIQAEVNMLSERFDSESIYFYSLISDETKEYLAEILEGKPRTDIESKIIGFGKPLQVFGDNGIEMTAERNYQKLSLAVAKNFNKDLSKMSAKDAIFAIKELKSLSKPDKK